jgi:hypothetical protein
MRLVQGRGLDEAIRAYHQNPAPLAFRDLVQRFSSVCQTIAYAHSKGVVHRDLKPANIMLGDFGETLVMDWGLAKFTADGDREQGPAAGASADEALTMAGAVFGTPAFMAPEQARGDTAQVGPSADVYALGAVLYNLLIGRSPYAGKSDKVLKLLRQGPPDPPRSIAARVPRPLEAICLKAMARAPELRYAGAADLGKDVERWLADEPVTAYRERPAERAVRWARRYRTGVAVAAVALVLALVGASAGAILQARALQDRSQLRIQLMKADQAAEEAARAGRQGDWRAALDRLDEATSLGPSDPVRVRLARVKALQALGETGRSWQELDALARESDLRGHAGEVALLQADALLLQRQEQEAVELLRWATASRPRMPLTRRHYLPTALRRSLHTSASVCDSTRSTSKATIC